MDQTSPWNLKGTGIHHFFEQGKYNLMDLGAGIKRPRKVTNMLVVSSYQT